MTTDNRRLSLAWQHTIGRRLATDIGVSQTVVGHINRLLPPKSNTILKTRKVVKDEKRVDAEEDYLKLDLTHAMYKKSPAELASVFELLTAPWVAIAKHPEYDSDDVDHINKHLMLDGIEYRCGPNESLLPDKVLTLRMQNLLHCHVTEVGISFRTAQSLEEHADVTCLGDLLKLDWKVLESFTNPINNGGIPNFGDKSLEEIRVKLNEAGFSAPPGTVWIVEREGVPLVDPAQLALYAAAAQT